MTVRTGRVLPTEAFFPSAPLQREEYSYWRILIQIHVTAIGTNTGGGKSRLKPKLWFHQCSAWIATDVIISSGGENLCLSSGFLIACRQGYTKLCIPKLCKFLRTKLRLNYCTESLASRGEENFVSRRIDLILGVAASADSRAAIGKNMKLEKNLL